MEDKGKDKIISNIILAQSVGSVRIVIALFVLGAIVTKLLYNKYLPELVDFDELRWIIITLGSIFFLLTFIKFKSHHVVAYLSFFVYSLTLIYIVSFTLINKFDPNVVVLLILIIGASTIIISSLTFYGVQSALILVSSLIAFQNTSLPPENTIAFFNLLLAIGAFAIVIIVRLKLVSSVKHSYANLEKLQILSIVVNKSGDVVFVSSSARTVLGYEPKDLTKDGWWQLSNLQNGWISREYILDHPNILDKELTTMESSIAAKDGKTKWLSWANSVLPNGNYMGIAIDITKYMEK